MSNKLTPPLAALVSLLTACATDDEPPCRDGECTDTDLSAAFCDPSTCPLGCLDDHARCRELVPSNGLSTYFDQVARPPDVDLSGARSSIDTGTGIVTSDNAVIAVPSFLVPSRAEHPYIRVLVVGNLRLGDVAITNDTPTTRNAALAILASGVVTVAGHVRVTAGAFTGAGDCQGGTANATGSFDESTNASSGSGGGAHATNGGAGGNSTYSPGAIGGVAAGTPELIPLRGGCPSGGARENAYPVFLSGARGGGALQISSRVAIRVEGTIDASGEPGFGTRLLDSAVSYGGGGGGGILLEAPRIDMGPSGALLARGGDGDGCPPAMSCTIDSGVYWGRGGAAATNTAPARDGEASMNVPFAIAGGGGGGLGRIRINTLDGTFASSGSIGVLTTGWVSTH